MPNAEQQLKEAKEKLKVARAKGDLLEMARLSTEITLLTNAVRSDQKSSR